MSCWKGVGFLFASKLADVTLSRQAKLDTFEEDLNLTGADFSTAVSILNVG